MAKQSMLCHAALASVLLAGGNLVSFAQTKVPSDAPPDVQTPAQTGKPAPAASPVIPAANPARPTISNPATLTPVGYLQFETGVLGAADSPEFSSRTGMNEVIK